MIAIYYSLLSKTKIALRLFLFTLLSSFLLYLISAPGLIAAKTDQPSFARLNVLNIYGGTTDAYYTVEDGAHKKPKAHIKEYGFTLELEDRFEPWKADFRFSQWKDSQLQGEDFLAKLNYVFFKTNKAGISAHVHPYIGGALTYHYNKINFSETTPSPNDWFNPYQQILKGYGAGPQIGIKLKDFPFKKSVWNTEIGGAVSTFKSSLIKDYNPTLVNKYHELHPIDPNTSYAFDIEEEFISTRSFYIDTHLSTTIHTIYLGIGYQFKRIDLDDKYLPFTINKYDKAGESIGQDKKIVHYLSSRFTQHLFYFSLSYLF
ncbi:MAG: hypothetical protein ACMUIP_12845 [bacterium]